eukprot:Nk52_evm4s292 gene=Nk52_evmTU4s292
MEDYRVKRLNDNPGKGGNRFKFQSFAERINSLKIDVTHKIGHVQAAPEEGGSFFNQSLLKWTELNCTTHFTEFRVEVYERVQTLPQLVFHKDEIVQCLIKHLRVEKTMALEPLLELVVELARDLREQFYPYFKDMFYTLVELLDPDSPDNLKFLFSCLSFLFKYLLKYLVKDIDVVFGWCKELLVDKQKAHVRHFTAEAFSYVLRKLKPAPLRRHLGVVFDGIDGESSDSFVESIADILFETVKGVKMHFHSRMPEVMGLYLSEILDRAEESEDQATFERQLDVIKVLMRKMYEYSGKKRSEELMRVIFERFQLVSDEVKAGNVKGESIRVLMEICKFWVDSKGGKLFTQKDVLALANLLDGLDGNIELEIEMVAGLVKAADGDTAQSLTRLVNGILKKADTEVVFRFFDMLDIENSGKAFLPPLIFFANGLSICEQPVVRKFFSSYLPRMSSLSSSVVKHANDRILFPQCASGKSFPQKTVDFLSMWHAKECNDNFKGLIEDESMLSDVLSALKCLRYMEVTSALDMAEAICKNVGKAALSSTGLSEQAVLCEVFCELCFLMCSFWKDYSVAVGAEVIECAMSVLEARPGNVHVLRGTSAIIEYLVSLNMEELQTVESYKLLSNDHQMHLLPLLTMNMSSHIAEVRLLSLTILSSCKSADFVSNSRNDLFTGECTVFDMCLDAGQTEPAVGNFKTRVGIMRNIEKMMEKGAIPGTYRSAVIRYILSGLHVNFTPLWQPLIDILVAEASRSLEEVWEIVFAELEKFYSLKDAVKIVTGIGLDLKAEDISGAIASSNSISYFSSLCKLIAEIAPKIERYSKRIVPLFLWFMENEYYIVHEGGANSQNVSANRSESESEIFCRELQEMSIGRRAVTQKLVSFLDIFAKFNNPKALFRAAEVRETVLDLLMKTDNIVQDRALKCLFTYKFPYINPYKEILENIVNERTFRDELTKFTLDSELTIVLSEHRTELLGIVIRILFGNMTRRKGNSSARNSLKTKRQFILAFLSGLRSEELTVLFDIISTPFRPYGPLLANGCVEMKYLSCRAIDIENVIPLKKQLGFLNVLEDLVKQLGVLIKPYIHQFVSYIVLMVKDTEILLGEKDALDAKFVAAIKDIRLTSLKRLCTIFEVYPNVDYSALIEPLFCVAINDRLAKIGDESLQSSSGLVELFYVWSRHGSQVNILLEHKDVLPSVFKCLSSKSVSSSVVSRIFDIVDNILDFNTRGEIPEEAFKCHFELMINHLSDLLFNTNLRKGSNELTSKSLEGFAGERKVIDQEKRERTFNARLLSIVSKVSVYCENSTHGESICDLLLPFLKAECKDISEKAKGHVLVIITNFLQTFRCNENYYRTLSRLFLQFNLRSARTSLAECFKMLGRQNEDALAVNDLICNLNAFNPNAIDEPDFERRLSAFLEFNKSICNELTIRQLEPVLFNCIFFIYCDDLSIRNNASQSVICILRKLEASIDEEGKTDMLERIIYPAIKKGMKSFKEVTRAEFLNVLHEYIRLFPANARVADMGPFLLGDEESNFFVNVTHIQIHRKIRALKQLQKNLESNGFTQGTLVNIFLPLCSHFIFENQKTHEHNLIFEAVSAIGAIAKQLSWGHYIHQLRLFLRQIPQKQYLEKVLIKVVISMLDSFHFTIADDTSGVDGDKEGSLSSRIHATVLEAVLPELTEYLVKTEKSKNDDKAKWVSLRSPVALAVVKLLMKLPEDSLKTNLPGLLTKVCYVLKNPDEDVRSEARETLVKIQKSLGPRYFHFILEELRGALNSGYKVHILGFTVRSLLKSLVESLQADEKVEDVDMEDGQGVMTVVAGDIDDSVESLLDVLVNDIFGVVAEEKEVAAIAAKMKESKVKTGFDSIEMVAKLVSFTSYPKILQKIKLLAETSSNHKQVRKLEEFNRRFVLGVSGNTTVKIDRLLLLSHSLIKENLDELKEKKKDETEEPAIAYEGVINTYRIEPEPGRIKAKPLQAKLNSSIMIELGLAMLLNGLKSGSLNIKNKDSIALLDPFARVLRDCLLSKSNGVVVLSLKVLCFVLKFPLPSLENNVSFIAERIFKLINRKGVGVNSNELVQNSFRCVTVVIREFKKFDLSENKMKALLHIAESDLEDIEKQNVTFAMIKAIVGRKMVIPEIYDLMKKISDLMVRSQVNSIRQLCSQVFLQFLLDYPLGQKRLQTHMLFLLKNLAYEYQTGRESVLDFFNSLLLKFPVEVIEEYAESMFLPLMAMVVNDEVPECRAMAAEIIKKLFAKVTPDKCESLFKVLVAWVESDNNALKRVAIQGFSLFIDVFSNNSDMLNKRIATLFPTIVQIVSVQKDFELADCWEPCYYGLGVILKICKLKPFYLENDNATELLKICSVLIRHPHTWVRLQSSRMIGLYFSHRNEKLQPSGDVGCNINNDFLESEGTLFELGKGLCWLLRSKYLDDKLAEQLVRNMFFIGKVMVENENLRFIEPHDLDSDTENDNDQSEDGLDFFFKTMSDMARKESSKQATGVLKKMTALKWFAAMCSYLKKDAIIPFVPHILALVYRLLNQSEETCDEELRTFASQLSSMMEQLIGTSEYFSLYNKCRQSVDALRANRKKQRVIQGVIDPAAAARRKVKQNLLKKESRKRKINDLKSQSGRAAKASRVD